MTLPRRDFLAWGVGVAGCFHASRHRHIALPQGVSGAHRVVRTACPAHNCGGRCLLKVTVEGGRIRRIEGDDRPGDGLGDPQLRPCLRGRLYRGRQDHPDRLLHPLKRVGKRGEGHFQRIPWKEALDLMASEFQRVRATHGNAAMMVPYGSGGASQLLGRATAQRLLNLFGGSLGVAGNYSWAAMAAAWRKRMMPE